MTAKLPTQLLGVPISATSLVFRSTKIVVPFHSANHVILFYTTHAVLHGMLNNPYWHLQDCLAAKG
jgi:hypothetical protein